MIRPIAPTHQAATERAERIKQVRKELDDARRATLVDNVALLLVVLSVSSGAILFGLLISWLLT